MGSRLGIIGGGNMGSAILRGCLEAGVLAPGDVVLAEIDPQRRRAAEATGCTVTGDPRDVLDCEQIMLAVKPQSFPDVAGTLGPLPGPRIVISIMAGLASERIRAALGEGARVVRVMPNTPCRIGAGAAAIALGEGARPGDEALAVAVLDAVGRSVVVDEALMDAVTALSGSGPAYVFLLAEAMEQAAADLGLPADQAALLVRQTVLGAARLLAESGQEPEALRRAVTSPGGTTEAALEVMLDRGLPAIVADAVRAARDRGAELNAQ